MTDINDFSSASEEPLYNIGVVSRMTDIPVATLRVWERRYGFPTPARTEGRHRLYSERGVIRLRWVKARIDEGMQTGQAVQALKRMEEEGSFPETPLFTMADERRKERVTPSLHVFQERLTNALLNHDIVRADQLLGEVLALYPLEHLILEVISPALTEIGTAWRDGRINVATEHLATNYLRHRLLMWMVTGPPAYPIRPVLLACAPDEWHEGGLMATGVLLRRQRWPVAYLGQAVPLADLAKLVKTMKPPGVVFVAMTEGPAAALAEWPLHLPEAAETGRPVIGYGGLIYVEKPEWQSRMQGVFLGNTLHQGLETLERLLRDTTGLSF